MSRLGALCLVLAACADTPQPARSASSELAAAPPSGPVIGPAMTPAARVEAPPAPKGELLAPAVFPAPRAAEVALGPWLPATISAAARERFAAAEQSFSSGDLRGADKLLATLRESRDSRDSLAPWIALARLRIRAAREEWPTSVGGADADARVASALTWLAQLDLTVVPAAARGPFLLERGRWLLVHGDYTAAREVLEQAATTLPDEPEALSLLGLARLATGQVQQALEPIERATALDPGSAERWGNLGTIRMMNAKVNEAARAYEARVRLAPHEAQGHADLGLALVQLGELTRARAELLRATELSPEHASYLSSYAYALHRSGKLREARSAYERALQRDPKLLVGLLGYSALLSENPAELAQARKLLERAEKVAPTDPRVLAAEADLRELESKHH